MKLVLKLIAGIVAGILVGLFAPEWITRLLVTFKVLFGELLFFTVPLLILFYITSGIAGLPRNSGALLGRTLATALDHSGRAAGLHCASCCADAVCGRQRSRRGLARRA